MLPTSLTLTQCYELTRDLWAAMLEAAPKREASIFHLEHVATRMQMRVDAIAERGGETVGISLDFAREIVRAISRLVPSVSDEHPSGEDAAAAEPDGGQRGGDSQTPSPSLPETTGSEAKALEFKTEIGGARVATLLETSNQIIEVLDCKNGLYDLTIHHYDEDRGLWDDMTAYNVKGEVLARLGCLASPLPTGTDYAGPSHSLIQQIKDALAVCDVSPEFVSKAEEALEAALARITQLENGPLDALYQRAVAAEQALLTLQQERDDLDRRATEYALQCNDQALRLTALQQKNKELERDLEISRDASRALQQKNKELEEERDNLAKALDENWVHHRRIVKAEASLTASQAECERLRTALEPFEEVSGEGDEDYPDDTKVTVQFGRTTYHALTLGDFRRARTALSSKENEHD